jgi:hypothetical protein
VSVGLRRTRPSAGTVRAGLILTACIAPGPSLLPAQSGVPVLRLETDVRLVSGAGGPADTTFLVVADGAMGPNDEIYLADPTAPGVYVFDVRGSFVRRIGRAGDGPGEFRWPVTIGLLRDTLWVGDPTTQRVSLFTASGAFVRTLRAPVGGVPRMLADGSLVVQAFDTGHANKGEPRRIALLRFRSAEAAVDTVALLRRLPLARARAGGEAYHVFEQFFTDGDLWAAASDGSRLVLVDQRAPRDPKHATFTVTALDVDGSLLRRTHVSYTPLRLDDRGYEATIDRFVDAMMAQGRMHMPRDRFARAVREATLRPEFLPPATAVIATPEGNIWLRREDPALDDVTWQVLSMDGRTLGTVTLPTAATVFAVSGRSVLVGRHYDDGRMEVTRYRYR